MAVENVAIELPRDVFSIALGKICGNNFRIEFNSIHSCAPLFWRSYSNTSLVEQGDSVGYEIPFNRHFYKFTPPRQLEEIDADLATCTDRIKQMIEGLSV